MSTLARPDLGEILACPHCFGAIKELAEKNIRCGNCMAVFPIRDGIPHFREALQDIVPDPGGSYLHDKKAWSSWRKKNYAFFDSELAAIPADSLIIDVGAGPGFFRDLFQKHRCYAVDFFPYRGIDIVTDIVRDKPPIRSAHPLLTR
jgi:hypothetical protein